MYLYMNVRNTRTAKQGEEAHASTRKYAVFSTTTADITPICLRLILLITASSSQFASVCMCVCVFMCMCVRVCESVCLVICVSEREKEREGEKGQERKVYVLCVCVCVFACGTLCVSHSSASMYICTDTRQGPTLYIGANIGI